MDGIMVGSLLEVGCYFCSTPPLMFYFILSFLFLFALDVGGLGFVFCASWRHALQSD